MWNHGWDVVIIGSGAAGLSGAVEAAGRGNRVLVLEKMKAPGGNTLISEGGIAAALTPEQKAAGIEDSPELFAKDMLASGQGLSRKGLVRVLTEGSAEALAWTKKDLGIRYMDRLDRFGGHSVPRCYLIQGAFGAPLVKALRKKAGELGVDFRFASLFQRYIQDTDGRILGVEAGRGYDYRSGRVEEKESLKAEKAVILAVGGFGADVAFRTFQDPRLSSEIDTTNQPFATAEALKETLKITAAPVHLSAIQTVPWTSPDEKGFGAGPAFTEYTAFPYGIIVDTQTGRRIVNELGGRKPVADALMNAAHPCVAFSDRRAVSRSGFSFEKALQKKVVRQFPSLSALAAGYDIPLPELKETLKRYNGFLSSGKDEDFQKPLFKDAASIEEPPFYAMRVWPKVHYTMGGVAVDERTAVLDLDGRPIPGLFAAGEVTGGIHGANRLSCCALTECLVFGRIAGAAAGR